MNDRIKHSLIAIAVFTLVGIAGGMDMQDQQDVDNYKQQAAANEIQQHKAGN